MEVTICTTRAGDPEVHKAGCRDIKRGLATRKFQDIDFDTVIASVLDATVQYWDNGILDEAYGSDPDYYSYSTKIAAARGYVGTLAFAPCVKGLPAEDEKIVEFLSGNPSETAADAVDSSQEENTKEGEKMTETQTPETTSPTGRTTTGDNGHGHQPKATPKPAPPRRGAKAKKTSVKGATVPDPKSGQKLGTGPNAATSTPVAKSDPKPEKLNAKRALADEVIAALGALAKGKSDEDRLTISKWVHHLPADHAAWVKVLPNPGRSDWK